MCSALGRMSEQARNFLTHGWSMAAPNFMAIVVKQDKFWRERKPMALAQRSPYWRVDIDSEHVKVAVILRIDLCYQLVDGWAHEQAASAVIAEKL